MHAARAQGPLVRDEPPPRRRLLLRLHREDQRADRPPRVGAETERARERRRARVLRRESTESRTRRRTGGAVVHAGELRRTVHTRQGARAEWPSVTKKKYAERRENATSGSRPRAGVGALQIPDARRIHASGAIDSGRAG